MYRKISQKNIIADTRGAVIIEFVFVFLIIALFMKLIISMAEHYSTMGKLDLTSYSLAGIIRERSQLYDGDNILSQEQVNQLKRLADNMLLNAGNSNLDFSIKVETVHFNPTGSSAIENKIIDNTKSLSFGVGACEPKKPLRELIQLSTFSNAGRWIPLYQVTLCSLNTSWYNRLLNQEGPDSAIKSSSITVER